MLLTAVAIVLASRFRELPKDTANNAATLAG
jgi:hypothetical protein